MDELELIRAHRREETETAPASRRAARAVLEARMGGAEPASARPRRDGLGRGLSAPRRGTRLLALGACAVVIAAALVLGLSGGGGRVEPAAAAQVLRAAARTAAGQTPLVPGPHQYLYARERGAELLTAGRWSVMVPAETEEWISLDGSRKGRIRISAGHPYFLSEGQRGDWRDAGSPRLPKSGTEELTVSGRGAMVDPAELPQAPVALREALEEGRIPGDGGPRDEVETFEAIGELLGQAQVPAAGRSALFEAAAELPAIESLGEVEDPLGRRGVGIALVDERRAVRHELIVDPDTSALLAERQTTTARRYGGFVAPIGTTIGWRATLESRIVDSVGRHATSGAGAFDDSVGCYETASLHASGAVLHGRDPIAICEDLWREGVLGTRLRRLEEEAGRKPGPHHGPPRLVACTEDGTPALVFPGPGPGLCARLGLRPLDREAWRSGGREP